MVRKQFYIEPRQDRMLKRCARKTGVTEAAIVRRALDAEVGRLESDKEREQAWREEHASSGRVLQHGDSQIACSAYRGRSARPRDPLRSGLDDLGYYGARSPGSYPRRAGSPP